MEVGRAWTNDISSRFGGSVWKEQNAHTNLDGTSALILFLHDDRCISFFSVNG